MVFYINLSGAAFYSDEKRSMILTITWRIFKMETALTLVEQNKPTLAQLVLVNMARGTTREQAEMEAIKEIDNLQSIMLLKPELLNCDPTSVLLVVKQCINDNLSLAQGSGLVYLYPSKIAVGKDSANQTIYKEVLVYDPTANGRLSIARQAGRILDNKRPVCTYDEKGAVKDVTVEFLVPSYPNPRWEVITFGKPYFEKWKQKSLARFKTANANYSSFNGGIDPEFAGSKAIRHGLDKLGTNMNESKRNRAVANDFKAEPVASVMKEAGENTTEDISHVEIKNESPKIVDVKDEDLC